MKRTVLVMVLFAIAISRCAYAFDEEYYNKLLVLNDNIKALEEFKDSPEMIKAKMLQVDYINDQRRANGAQEVKLDLFAGRVANMHAREGVDNNYFGHWDMNGFKPYLRYGVNGGRDHVSENGYSRSGGECATNDPESALSVMKGGLDTFMAEGPGGGHHDNVIGSYHNYVGLGFYCAATSDIYGNEQRYFEEYVDRYIQFGDFSQNLSQGQEITITGRVIPEDTGIYAATIFYEPFPKPMTPEEISARGGYGDFTDESEEIWPWDIKFNKDTRKFTIPFTAKKEGYYYVQLSVKEDIDSIPYEITGGGVSASTGGLPVASGLIFAAGAAPYPVAQCNCATYPYVFRGVSCAP